MKAKTKSSLSPKFRQAYDLKKERQECKRLGVQTRIIVAWMQEGEVLYSSVAQFKSQTLRQSKREAIFNQWLRESCVSSSDTNQLESAQKQLHLTQCVQCLLASSGGHWAVWKYQDVSRAILNPQGRHGGRVRDFIPERFTIFDRDRAANVWQEKHDETVCERSIHFGKALLMEAARIYELSCLEIEYFEHVFNASDGDVANSKASQIASLLKDCVKAIKMMFYAVSMLNYERKGRPDLAVALRQGFLIGRWLMQAEAIVANKEAMKMASHQGVSGQHPSAFWDWIISEPDFMNATAKSIFDALEGKRDPDYPGAVLTIIDGNKLRRGNGDYLKQSSFVTALSRNRKSAKNR